jgi:hypothetical protein
MEGLDTSIEDMLREIDTLHLQQRTLLERRAYARRFVAAVTFLLGMRYYQTHGHLRVQPEGHDLLYYMYLSALPHVLQK